MPVSMTCFFFYFSPFADSLATHAERDLFGSITGCDTHESTNAIRNSSAKFAIRNSIELIILPSINEFIPVSLGDDVKRHFNFK